MLREFSDATGERWTASENGFYFDHDFPQDEVFSEGAIADVEFRSERGRRATGYMTRGEVDSATEAELRDRLAEALWESREVQ
jgi:hypothetical protein